MLAYAFQILKSDAYSFCETEEFENAADLLAAILEKGCLLYTSDAADDLS